MNRRLLILLPGILLGAVPVTGQPPASIPIEIAVPPITRPRMVTEQRTIADSSEQGQSHLHGSFDPESHGEIIEARRGAFEDTQFEFNFRTMFFDRDKFDGSVSQALATGGWIGAKTGYFRDRIAFGITGYTSQRIEGEPSEDGTSMLEPVQAGYTVLGEAYTEVLIIDDLHFYAGRKGFDTPFINRDDSRMTPKTFELLVLQGISEVGSDGGTLRYGAGWFDKIKERNSDEFVSMGMDAGAPVERGVFAGGANYVQDTFSLGAIHYHSADLIDIFYTEAKTALPFQLPFADNSVPTLAAQIIDQRGTGDNLLTGAEFSASQFGIKSDLPVGDALFTAGYTIVGGGSDLQNPWSSYPGYTSVQVEEFDHAGEGALLLRAAYDFPCIDGLSAYALFANGSRPDDPSLYRKNEVDLNLQWAPSETCLKGLSLRLRYALVEEYGPTTNPLTDFRVICNYVIEY